MFTWSRVCIILSSSDHQCTSVHAYIYKCDFVWCCNPLYVFCAYELCQNVGDRLSQFLRALSKASFGATHGVSIQRHAWPQTFETVIAASSTANVRFSVFGLQVWLSSHLREFRCETHHQSSLPGGPVCFALLSNEPWLALMGHKMPQHVTNPFTIFHSHRLVFLVARVFCVFSMGGRPNNLRNSFAW